MGQIIDETHYERESDNERWLFSLTLYSDPADDFSCTIRKQVLKDSGWELDESEGVYQREFDRESFNEHHYEAFREKWVREPEYREQYYDPETSVHLHFKKEEEARIAGDLDSLKDEDGALPSRHQ